MIRQASEKDRPVFNTLAEHPLQSWEWGEFRKSTGVEVTRLIETDESKECIAVYQLTWHKIPKTSYQVGYLPKSALPSEEAIEYIKNEANKRKAIFVKMEPNVKAGKQFDYTPEVLLRKGKPLFTKYTFILNIERSEDEILKRMNQKTRYNVRLAEKKGVEIVKDNSEEAFEEYWRLTEETTKRQGFYSHTKSYHKKMWQMMTTSGIGQMFKAVYNGEVLTTWMIFVLNKKLYYPYGASTNKYRDTMANNLMMWEVIKHGKKMGCKEFDMWGSLGSNPDPKDSWYGFHRFKQGYGGVLTEFLGTYDIVIYPTMYEVYRLIENVRWFFLRVASKLR